MKNLHITIEYNKPRRQYDVYLGNFFVQEFDELKWWQKALLRLFAWHIFPCRTMPNVFEDLDKSKVNKFIIDIKNDNS